MDKIEQLYNLGKKNNLSGDNLDEWVDKRLREIEEREARKADREAEKQRKTLELEQNRIAAAEKAKFDFELEKARIGAAKLELEAKIELAKLEASKIEQESKTKLELARLNAEADRTRQVDVDGGRSQCILSKLPKFDDNSDNLDSYIRRFETIARSANVPESQWGTQLLILIGGKGLDACQSLSEIEMKEYKTLKSTLLEYYHLTENAYRLKFHSLRPSDTADFKMFANEIKTTFEKWFEASGLDPSFESLVQFVMVDKVLNSVDKDVFSYLQERKPRDLKTVTDLCQKYQAAHPDKPMSVNATQFTPLMFTTQVKHKPTFDAGSPPYPSRGRSPYRGNPLGSGNNRSSSLQRYPQCFNCQQFGHTLKYCPALEQDAVQCFNCNRFGHMAKYCRKPRYDSHRYNTNQTNHANNA